MPVRVWGGADLLRFEGGIEDSMQHLCFRRGAVGESLLIFSIVKEVMTVDLASLALPQTLDRTLLISSYHAFMDSLPQLSLVSLHLPCHISPMLKFTEGWTRWGCTQE